MIFYFLIQPFCKHNYEFDSNIYGEFVIMYGYNRSIWKCSKCNKYQHRPEYIDEEKQKSLKRKQKIKKIWMKIV